MIYDLLFPYQKNIIDTYQDKKAFGLWVDMGLGKTPLSLAFAERHQCTKIIIISINSKALETKDVNGSFFWWLNKSDVAYNMYNKSDFKPTKKHEPPVLKKDTNDALIVNYEALFERKSEGVQLKDFIINFIKSCYNNNVAVIVDESHKLKDAKATQTKSIQLLLNGLNALSRNVYTYLLTGTPFTKGYIDLYSQLKFLGCKMTKTTFCDTYCIRGHYPSLMPWEQPITGYKNVDALFRLVHNFAITIKTNEVIDLPEQIFVSHNTPMTNEMKLFTCEKLKADTINKEFVKRKSTERVEKGKLDGKVNNPFYRNINYPDCTWLADTTATQYIRARQLSIGFQGNEDEALWFNYDRLKELERLLEQNEDNYVLFYNFTPEFLEIYEICEKLGYKIDVYNGIIKNLKYYNEYSNLSEEEKITDTKRIILANFQSGSTGVNWQLYNKCILFSLPVFRDYAQGLKRVHRVGQKNIVTYHIFKGDNWLDNSMWKALNESKDYDENLFKADMLRVQELLGD